MKDSILMITLAVPAITLTGTLQAITIVSLLANFWTVYRREKVLVEDRFDGSWARYMKDAFKTKLKRKNKQ